jgi:hypothetical protein
VRTFLAHTERKTHVTCYSEVAAVVNQQRLINTQA